MTQGIGGGDGGWWVIPDLGGGKGRKGRKGGWRVAKPILNL
jgi:hypothetical protein